MLKLKVFNFMLLYFRMCFLPRENLVYLQVGFKTMSYDLQEEQPAYDTNSLFGMLFYVITKVLSIFPTYNSRLGVSQEKRQMKKYM